MTSDIMEVLLVLIQHNDDNIRELASRAIVKISLFLKINKYKLEINKFY